MEFNVRKQLLLLAEEKYQRFSSSLLPGVDNILGVRLPALRKIAKAICKEDWRDFLKNAEDFYFEEIMIQAMVIGQAKCSIEETLSYFDLFLPKINNWSVCDTFCGGLKNVKGNEEIVWKHIMPLFSSKKEYEARVAAVLSLHYFITKDYISSVLSHIPQIKQEGYYAKMAAAWCLSICYIHFPKETLFLLHTNTLDTFTHNKTIQKICESLRVEKEEKLQLKKLRK